MLIVFINNEKMSFFEALLGGLRERRLALGCGLHFAHRLLTAYHHLLGLRSFALNPLSIVLSLIPERILALLSVQLRPRDGLADARHL